MAEPSRVHRLTTCTLTTRGDLQALQSEWDGVAEVATQGPIPFLTWTWVWHWWHHTERRRDFSRSRLRIMVMRDSTDQVRAIFPFFLVTWGRGPLAFRGLRLLGFRTNLLDERQALIYPGWEAAAAIALRDTLQVQRHGYDLCILDGVERTSPFAQALHRVYAVNPLCQWGPVLTASDLILPPTWQEMHARLSHNNRRSVRQGMNAIKRDGLRAEFEVVATPDALSVALEEFFCLHRARAERVAGLPHTDYYAAASDRDFLRRLSSVLATEGNLRIGRLKLDGRAVASRLLLRAGEGLYLYHAGHDPAWARYRVGVTLTAECLRLAVTEGHKMAFLGTGEDASKARWRPQERLLDQLQVFSSTVRGRLLQRAGGKPLTLATAIVRSSKVRGHGTLTRVIGAASARASTLRGT